MHLILYQFQQEPVRLQNLNHQRFAGKLERTNGRKIGKTYFILLHLKLLLKYYNQQHWTPLILIGVPPVKLCGTAVTTVTTLTGVAPSPDSILDILRGSAANAPTISNSGLCGANPFAQRDTFE